MTWQDIPVYNYNDCISMTLSYTAEKARGERYSGITLVRNNHNPLYVYKHDIVIHTS